MDSLDVRMPKADELLETVVDLCPFPAAAQRLMALTQDASAPIEAITNVVSCDPALTAQVLRIASSAAFRRPGSPPVRDLRKALVAMGLEQLRVMSGAMALLATFATREELAVDLHAASVVTGSLTAMLAPNHDGPRGLPFLTGLLCEVGALACMVVDGPVYAELWRRTVGAPQGWSSRAVAAREEHESKRYGATSRATGGRLLRHRCLPEEIASAVEAGPMQPPTAPLLHRATAFARMATPCLLWAEERSEASLAPLLAELAQWTSLPVRGPELVRYCMAAAAQAEERLVAIRK